MSAFFIVWGAQVSEDWLDAKPRLIELVLIVDTPTKSLYHVTSADY